MTFDATPWKALAQRTLSSHHRPAHKNVGGEEGEEYHGNNSVHGEEGGVETGEIIGLDEGMFVEQEQRDSGYPRDGEFAEAEGGKQRDQQ